MASHVMNCGKTSEIGSLPLTRGKITTSLVNLNIAELHHGGSMAQLSRGGSILVQAHSYGYMGNVSIFTLVLYMGLMISTI
jgi:hypothetical protein